MDEKCTAVAIICEYNPFHEGHAYLLERARKEYPNCRIISVMSGNTVQRGEFAIFDRYDRAAVATALGSDLTVELPYPYSCSSSRQFAMAGVRIAMVLGADVLMFGSGAEDVSELFDAAKIMKTENFSRRLGELAKADPGSSFLSQREKLYREITGKILPRDGNSSLGIEYIIAAEELSNVYGGTLKCHPIKREGDWSATACRTLMRDGTLGLDGKNELKDIMPEVSRQILGNSPISGGLDAIGQFVLGTLRSMAWRGSSFGNGNGIKEALIGAAANTRNLNELYAAFPTATYTRARLRRELMDLLLLPDIADTNAIKNTLPLYTVLLGATENGLKHLGEIRRVLEIPIITKPADAKKLTGKALEMYSISERVEHIYSLTFGSGVSPSQLLPRFKAKR